MESATTETTINLTKVCRVCLMEFDEMHSIFSEIQNEDNLEGNPIYLCQILMNISSIRVLAEDGLPTMLCTGCMESAHSSHKFQQQCNRSQEVLEAYIMQLPNKDYVEEDVIKDNSEQVLVYLDSNVTPSEELLEDVVEPAVPLTQDIKEVSIETEDLSSNSSTVPENDSNQLDYAIKTEIKEEPSLDAAKVAASEDNVLLRQRLAIKRLKADTGSENPKGQPAIGYSYYIKMNENGEKLYECNYCEKMYKHANSLKIHIRTHTLERPYLCSHCGKGFKQYGALSYHLRSHTGEQPYACKICGKRYRQSGTLTAHMRVHTGQKPFLCSVCGRGFRQAPDLGYHMRTHTKERPYMCNVCGKTMRMQCHLVQHMRIHTGERPFKCTECNKAFPSSTRLKRHAIIHTGLKPYTCEVCSKSFNRLSSLRVHAKIHTDERPHVCSICSKGFIQAHALRGHMHTHSSTDSFEKTT